jgi:uncharacterized protein
MTCAATVSLVNQLLINRLHLFVILCALAGCASLNTHSAKTELVIDGHRVIVEVASDEDSLRRGLAGRVRLDQNQGMLFEFNRAAHLCMWMKDTLIPLSVAYLDERGAIVNIEDMEPLTDLPHCSLKPVQFALEVPRGWFSARNIRPGATVQGVCGCKKSQSLMDILG